MLKAMTVPERLAREVWGGVANGARDEISAR